MNRDRTNIVASLLFLLFTASQSRPGAPPRDSTSIQAGTAAISGRITEHGTGRPLPRAFVTLGAPGSSVSRWLEAVADAEGRYEFTGVEPGEYTLTAGPGELRASHLRQVLGQKGPMDLSAGPPRPAIELKPGEVRSNVDIALTRALAIEGRVLDPRDEPMAEVPVVVLRADGTPYPSSSVYSDDRGEFRLFGLPPGRYRVCASPQTRFIESPPDTSRWVRTCHLASAAESSAADIVLESEDAAGIDIRIQRSATYSLAGSLTDAAGTLVDGAFVGAYRDDREVSGHATSRQGEFVLRGLTAGRYIVRASVGGPANPSDLRPPAREREVGYTSVTIDGADLSGVQMALSKGQKVSGRVIFEGRPTPRPNQLRMVVQTGETHGHAPFERPPFSAVDSKLEFELNDVFRLPLIVGLHGLPEGWVVASVRYAGREIADLATDFGAAPSRSSVDIVVTNRVAVPAIRVMDEQGAPVMSYHAVIVPADPGRWKGARWSVQGTPTRDGVMKLGARLPGDYLVAALATDDYRALMRDPSRIESVASVSRRVTLTEGDDPILELRVTKVPAKP